MSASLSVSGTPRVLSHRGNMPGFAENTLGGFTAALAAGADALESDVHVSADGVPVLFHDETLERLTGDPRRIAEVDSAELSGLDLGFGEGVPSLAEALRTLPGARWNLDMKSKDSPQASARVITKYGAEDRVLLASFSGRNRRAVRRLLPRVNTSASALQFLLVLVAAKLGLSVLVKRFSSDISALQIPERALGMDATTRRFVRVVHACGLRLEYWVINDEAAMRRLIERGADGVVTDNVALARRVVDDANAGS